MKDTPMTWGDASRFTWDELEYFKWRELALGKLELLKKKYDENNPLPPFAYEKLKELCNVRSTLPSEVMEPLKSTPFTIAHFCELCQRAIDFSRKHPELFDLSEHILKLVSALLDLIK